MSSLPDFDAEWRTQDGSLRKAQAALKAVIPDLDPGAILAALEHLSKEQKSCQMLSSNINAHYKRSRRERDELRVEVAAGEQCKKDLKTAKLKVKVYEARIKILKKQVIGLGGTIGDMKMEVSKELKRGHEQVEAKETYMTPMLRPEKRMKRQDDRVERSPETPSSSSLSPTTDASSIDVHSASKPDDLPGHLVRPRDFKRSIPLGKENKFASGRLAKPNKLHDPTSSSSHVTAVLQTLSATVKAHEVWVDLSEKEKQGPDFRLLKNDLTISELDDEVSKQQDMSAPKAVIDFLAESQRPHTRPLNAYPLQRHLSTSSSKSIDDPVKYMQHVLDQASTPSLKESFSAPHIYQSYCQICKGLKNEISFAASQFIPPKLSNEDAWLTNLTPSFSSREINYAKPALRTLEHLLATKRSEPEYIPCTNCALRNSSSMQKTWKGYAYAPSVLTLAFDRCGAKQYKLDLPLTHDFGNYVHAKGEKTAYRLAAVVKKMKSGMFAACVHGEKGGWHRCINDEVRRCEVGEWQGSGETVMAVYERLE